ncbi:MAG: Mur ligase family protein [Pseudomonadota bacterium]
MEKLDARRLTGINVIWQHPGAVVDVRLDPNDDADAVADQWAIQARRFLDALGWSHPVCSHRLHSGVALALAAPMDALYSAVEAAEWVFGEVAFSLTGMRPVIYDENDEAVPHREFDEMVSHVKRAIADECNPALQRVLTTQPVNATVLIDDDEISVGLGRYATTWPVDALPETIDWSSARRIPVGLVTGTNGKTTTVRLTQRMLRAAGNRVGISSTDWIGVDDTIIDRGDYSGPGGARAVLRQNIDTAVLETARGGLLRRGLGMPRADASLITNIAEDHLGDFGSENLDELLDLKWIVTRALDTQSVAILNADDPLLVAKASELSVPLCWFGLEPDADPIRAHIANAQPVVTVKDNVFCRFDGNTWRTLCAIDEAPITVGGSARHNVANSLAAIALAHFLGADDESIVSGLQSMQPNDNPGRCNFFSVNGVDVLLDFAHNPSAMQAIFDIARSHPAQRRLLCFGQAGDRTDDSIRELAQLAWAIGLDHVCVSELGDYRRGRAPQEVFHLLKEGLLSAGAQEHQISHHERERESLDHALHLAHEGDLIIMIALGEARALLEWLNSYPSASIA